MANCGLGQPTMASHFRPQLDDWTQLDAIGRGRARARERAGARASACAHARARRGATIRLISFLPQVAQDHFCNLFMET